MRQNSRQSPSTVADKLAIRFVPNPILALALFFSALPVFAQESSSVSGQIAAGPAGALSQVLTAACSQSQTDFAKFLTARNKQAFARMTPAARISFMKRFVLLSQPGKATTTLNVSGRPTVRCETPGGAAEIQIGGADQQDNLAILPVELRDATDTSGTDVVRVSMGLVREESQWRLVSLGVVFLDLPALEVEWNSEEINANESAALDYLKMVAQAVENYRVTYLRLPETLAQLGPPPLSPSGKSRVKPSAETSDMLDAELAAGTKGGYAFRYVVVGASTLGAVARFEVAASPSPYGNAGKRSYFRDAAGAVHGADHRGAVGSANDPKIE